VTEVANVGLQTPVLNRKVQSSQFSRSRSCAVVILQEGVSSSSVVNSLRRIMGNPSGPFVPHVRGGAGAKQEAREGHNEGAESRNSVSPKVESSSGGKSNADNPT
jgi:hypothetical protein